MRTRRSLVTVLVIVAVLAGCGNKETGEARPTPPPSLVLSPSVQSTAQSTIQPTPTIFVPGPLFDSSLDLRAGPVEVPLELQIPSLDVNAPMLGVGLTPENVMDSPRGPIDDLVWHTAFWYRGSGIPGEVGTATIAGHVDGVHGRAAAFARLKGFI